MITNYADYFNRLIPHEGIEHKIPEKLGSIEGELHIELVIARSVLNADTIISWPRDKKGIRRTRPGVVFSSQGIGK